ncbi:MAG: Bug family tripartite tricarboxylate transporter substrate binding protein [Gemmatimonas sp.]
MRTTAILAMAAVLATAGAANAQSPEAFYKGKSVRLIIASGSGGGYDTYGRVLARWMPNYVPGKPNFVVQNMDGAGGLKATNYTYAVAPKDGTVFTATYNALTTEPLIGGHGVEYDPLKFNWIGSMGKQQQICTTWHTSPIKTIEDAMKREVVTSSTGATGNSSTLPALLNQLLGTKFKVINGYGTSEMRLAVERGEVEGVCGLSYTTLIASSPAWILDKKINILLQTGDKRHPAMPDVPLAVEKAKTEDGKAILRLYSTPEEIGRPFVAPPGVPSDRVEALRRAFDATMADKGFLADAEKAHLEIDPVTGEDMERILKAAYSAPPVVVAKVREVLGREK